MEVKYRNIRILITTWLIVFFIVPTFAKTEKLHENSSQTTPLAVKSVVASLGNIESPFEILQRAPSGPKPEDEPESENKPEIEIKPEPEKEFVQETDSVSDDGIIAVAKLKTARLKSWYPMNALTMQRINTTLKEPLELWEKPDDAPQFPAYFTFKAGDRNVNGLTYRSTRNMEQVKFIFDTDGDGMLSDENVFLGQRVPMIVTSITYNFRLVTIQNAKQGISGGTFDIQCNDGEWFTIHPNSYRGGNVVLDGISYRIGIVDGDFDGKYNRIFLPPMGGSLPKCDIFAIDINGNHEFDFHRSMESELIPLSRFIQVKDKYYSIEVSEDGGTIKFRKANVEFGTLDLGGEEIDFRFWSDAMHYRIKGSDRTWQLPVGKYGVTTLVKTEKDSNGEKINFYAPPEATGKLAYFEIKPNQTTTIPLGKPSKIVTSMERIGDDVKLEFRIIGKAGESYIPGATKDGKNIPEPTFKVIDESGAVVYSGKFEYG